ncbi:MAG TPA: 5-formyltetrahydrofolate cyclo-ligase [Candidatus Saccharibacteria bacterium]|nr:5-formyltetrahydrofolate cyclo-ligase [Candidatus Saccharibacteria bacterium]HRK94215.1 5-formyltetrahydrofolate cyclo-ligase [Candidatus Saccharibacteria bacterium]
MDKAALRQEFMALRKNLPNGDVAGKSRLIARAVQNLVDWAAVHTVHAYRSNAEWSEAETSWIETFIAREWPQIAISYPPITNTAPISSGVFDVIIVPLVAFDDSCHRLGHGGGWYDRFLATQPNALKIGLAFDIQQVDILPVEEHDIPLDCIVTESRIIKRSAFRPSLQ